MLASTETMRGVGEIWQAGQFYYEEADVTATDHHLTTAGGIKLYLLPGDDGYYNFAGMNPAMNASPYAPGTGTDDYPLLAKLLPIVERAGTIGPSIFFPPGFYRMGTTIQLKSLTVLKGHSGGGHGSAVLLFDAGVRGIIVHRFNTINDTTESPTTTGGDYSVIDGLTIYSSTSGADATAHHGIWLRARATVQNCWIQGFAGHGIMIKASAGSGGSAEGNANCFYLNNVLVNRCGRCGCFIDGADANAGTAINCSFTFCGRYGLWDSSFLGNTHVQHHTAGNGISNVVNGNTTCYVSYGGNRYWAMPSATEAQMVATTPGTNSAVWKLVGAGGPTGDILTWVAAQPEGTYFAGGAYRGESSGNNASMFLGCYAESGQGASDFTGAAVAWGGFVDGAGFTTATGPILSADRLSGISELSVDTKINVSSSTSVLNGLNIYNSTSLSGVRRANMLFQIGQNANGTARDAGGIQAQPLSANTADSTALALLYYDGGLQSLAEAMFLRGDTKHMYNPSATWTLGRSTEPFVKGWFGNMSLFPAASVSPTVNGELTFQLTANNELALKVQGSDGTDRTGSIPLSSAAAQATVNTDADFTLTPGTSAPVQKHTGTLTADRAVTLSTTGATRSTVYRITRTGAGAFNLNVGTGPLKALATNTWADFQFDGTAYYLAAYGAL